MKIVHLCTMDFGGAGKAAYRLHKGLQSIGIDSTMLVISKKSNDTSVQVLPSRDINPAVDRWASIFQHWNNVLLTFKQRPKGLEIFTDTATDVRLDMMIEILTADVINLHWVAGLFDFEQVSQLFMRKKVVWTLHDMNPFTGGCHYAGDCLKYRGSCGSCPQLGTSNSDDLSRSIFKQKAVAYDNLDITIVTPSKWLGGCSLSSTLFRGFQHKVIPYGFPLDIFRPLNRSHIRAGLNIPSSTKVILFGADYVSNERKGFRYLIEALHYLKSTGIQQDLILAVFGNIDSAVEIACSYPVINFGSIANEEQMAIIYNSADVFVLPSLEDNLPNTVIEALACGTPVAAFNIGGVPDMVDHYITGHLATVADAVNLSESIAWCLFKAPDSIRQKCREKAESSFMLQQQAKRYLQLYSDLSADKGTCMTINKNGIDDRRFDYRPVPNHPYGQVEVDGIVGYLGQEDVYLLYKFAHSLPYGGTIIEVGSHQGLSAYVMTSALLDSGNHTAKIYCVDIWEGGVLDKFMRNMELKRVSQNIVPIQNTSEKASLTFADNGSDLIFIDGDHSYEGCRSDLYAWYPKLKPGGIMIGHDYVHSWPGVIQAADQFVADRKLEHGCQAPCLGTSIFMFFKPMETKMYGVEKPFISVVTPSYNQGKFIEQTIQSVLAQNYPNFEHFVIDGGSTDETLEILKKHPHLKWVSEKDKGQADALNKGFKMATGDIIAWINSDDWYDVDAFKCIADFFVTNPEKKIVMGNCNRVDEQGVIFDIVVNHQRSFAELSRYWVPHSIPTQPAIFFRRSLLYQYGFLDESLYYAMDYDLWMRFSIDNIFYHLDKTVANYRFHSAAKGGSQDWSKFVPEWKAVSQRYVNPLISVILPCYNYAQYLPDAVASVIGQTFQNFEIIIVNDGSTDNTKEVAQLLIEKYSEHSITLLNQANSGQPAISRNNGIAVAKADFILPLDADDVLPPDVLQNYIDAASGINDSRFVVYGWMQSFGSASWCWETYTFEPNEILRKNQVPSSSLFNRKLWEDCGGYSLNVKGYEDWDFWISAAERKAKFVCIGKIASYYRETSASSLQDYGRKNHEWNMANIITNHPCIYEPEEVAWGMSFLVANDTPPNERVVHKPDSKYPLAVSRLINSYPELYTDEEILWASSFARNTCYEDIKGIGSPKTVEISKKMSQRVIASVVICTYNRSTLLADSVSSIVQQNFPVDQYEIIVIDNNSNDNTRAITEALINISPVKIRYVPEKRQGLSFARNTGIENAEGEIVAFVDDDIDADQNWLAAMVMAYKDSQVACAGGPLRAVWPSERPEWLTSDWVPYLAVNEFENARITGEFNWPDTPWGANMSFRKKVFDTVGLFPTNLGRVGDVLLSNEELIICRKITAAGFRIIFASEAVIHHKIQPERLTKQWFYHRTYWQGRSDAILDEEIGANCSEVIRSLIHQFVSASTFHGNGSFTALCFKRTALGYLYQNGLTDKRIVRKNDFSVFRRLIKFLAEQRTVLV